MPEQTTTSRPSTQSPEGAPRHAEGERPASRAIGAALVAGAVAFGVSLYPLPDGPDLFDSFTPDQESSAEASKVDDSTFVKYTFTDFPTLKLPDLVKLVELNHDYPDLASGDLLDLVTTYGLPDVVKSLELLQSFSPLRHRFPDPPLGGGGGSGNVLPALVILLEYLEQNPPEHSGLGLLDAVTSIFSTLALSLGISHAVVAPQPDTRALALAAVAEFTATDAPVSALPDPSAAGFAGVPAPASADGPVAAPIEAAVPAPVDPPVAAPIEAPVPTPVAPPVTAPTETPTPAPLETSSAPEPTNVASHEPDPPSSDPPSSDPPSSAGGGSGGGSSGDAGGGSSGDAGGGSSGDSGGGTSGGG